MERNKDYMVEDGKENLRHFSDGFVAQAAEDEGARFVRKAGVAEAGTEGPGSGGVVGHIENPFDAMSGDSFQTTRPPGEAEAMSDGCRGDGIVVGARQFDRRGYGKGKVSMLMSAREWRVDPDGSAKRLDYVWA
jgi:hypothetical protein